MNLSAAPGFSNLVSMRPIAMCVGRYHQAFALCALCAVSVVTEGLCTNYVRLYIVREKVFRLTAACCVYIHKATNLYGGCKMREGLPPTGFSIHPPQCSQS